MGWEGWGGSGNLKQMPSERPSAKSEIFPRSQGRESFNYMPFALGWAISIFYVDTLRLHCTAIRFHLGEGIFCKNRLLFRSPTKDRRHNLGNPACSREFAQVFTMSRTSLRNVAK